MMNPHRFVLDGHFLTQKHKDKDKQNPINK